MDQSQGYQKPPVNAFSNDGSFMEQFKRMQEQQRGQQTEAPSPQAELSAKKPVSVSMKFGAVKKSTTPTLRTGIQRGSVKRAFGDDSDSEGEQVTQEDPTRGKPPPTVTPTATPPSNTRKISTGSVQARMSSQGPAPQAQLAGQKRKRVSRFDTTPGASAGSSSGSKSGLSSDELAIAEAMASFSDSSAGELSATQERQLQEQVVLNKMVAEIRAATQPKPKSMRNKGKKEKYEYDSDEDTEGGTWEHKKRGKEMETTLDGAMDLTEKGRGKHHIGDFLPPEELSDFMEKADAVKEGRTADLSDYRQHKLTEENIGFKLLQKAGWKEGTGLGSNEDGIVKPINKGKTSFEQAGVGSEKPGEVSVEDNKFDVYRKRMMLAYRFRPNPLNNPRRPYY